MIPLSAFTTVRKEDLVSVIPSRCYHDFLTHQPAFVFLSALVRPRLNFDIFWDFVVQSDASIKVL